MTSAGGGVAGKLGDRYEAWWTIFRGVLPVLDGEFTALRVEEPGYDAIEFRLLGGQDDARDEAHQCKNSDSGSWTVARLKTAGFLDEVARLTDRDTLVKFVSPSSSLLSPMAKKAIRLPFSAWQEDLSKSEETARDDLEREWGVTADVVHRRLRLLEFHTIDETTLRDAVLAQVAKTMEGDPVKAVAFLRTVVEDNLGGAPLTAQLLWAKLWQKGHPPRLGTDTAISEKLRGVVRHYLEQVDFARPPGMPLIPRAETDRIVQRLQAGDGPTVVALVGRPGTGKTSVLAEVCRRLAPEVLVGVLRLDLAEPVPTAAALGRQAAIGFGEAPAVAMGRAGTDRGAVLVIDQVDSVSSLSGRDPALLSALREVMAQAWASEDLKVLLACRSEDLRHDSALRRALRLSPSESRVGGDEADIETIDLGDLTPDQVQSVLDRSGLSYGEAPRALRELLRNAFNLALFARLYEQADELERERLSAFRTKLDLVAEYHNDLARRLGRSPGGGDYAATAVRLARYLSNRGVLSAPESVLADVPMAVDLMVHHGVLIREGRRLRFIHETLLEFLIALGLRQLGTSVAQLLADGPQELLRSGQVRALLALGKAEDTPANHLADLRNALNREGPRSHIRAAVFSMLGEYRSVTDSEFDLVFDRAFDPVDPLRYQARRTLASPPFAPGMGSREVPDFLASRMSGQARVPANRYQRALADLQESEIINLLRQLTRTSPDTTARAVWSLADEPAALGRTVSVLLDIVFLAGPSDDGSSVLELFRRTLGSVGALATSAPQDQLADQVIPFVFHDHGVHALSTIVQQYPNHGAAAIAAWLETAERICLHRGTRGLFQDLDDKAILDRRQTGLNIFAMSAHQGPVSFVKAVLPILIRDWQRTAKPSYGWRPAAAAADVPGLWSPYIGLIPTAHSLHGEIREALHQAMQLGAQTNAGELAPAIRPLQTSDLLPVHEALSHAYEHATGPLVQDAVAWLSDPRLTGLNRYLTAGWAWGAVLARVAEQGDPNTAIDIYETAFPPAATPADAFERMVALVLMKRSNAVPLPASLNHDVEAWEREMGPVPASPVRDLTFSPRERRTTSLLDAEATDEQWLDFIGSATHSGDEEGTMVLLDQASKRPERFAQLLINAPTVAPQSGGVVLRGISEGIDRLDASGRETVVRLLETPGVRGLADTHGMDVLRLIQHCAFWPLPPNVISLVPQIFAAGESTELGVSFDGNAGDRLLFQGLNSIRGAAVNTAGALLHFSEDRTQRLSLLQGMITAATVDIDESVRIFGPYLLPVLLAEEPIEYVVKAQDWLARATDAVLHSPNLGRLIWATSKDQPALAHDFLVRMLTSADPAVRQRAGNLTALLAVRTTPLAAGNDPYCLDAALADTAARRGVADYLAQLIDDLTDIDLLCRLADDEDDEVREKAVDFLRFTGLPLTEHAATLQRMAQTRAFAEHPSSLLYAINQRQDEIPESVLKLCETWAQHWVISAGDISTQAAASGYYVADIVFSIYARELPGSDARRRCLNLIDTFVELGVGDAEAKSENIAYQVVTDS
ncbi:ATP-binding protein [Actinoplanes italicus]|uniref:ATP-binding protein n=1 Tax=Actinoplanes italicus TaxID=113567 RepID=UPI0014727A6D|nr:ATP-binding protein [Actinoplanes italicus]